MFQLFRLVFVLGLAISVLGCGSSPLEPTHSTTSPTSTSADAGLAPIMFGGVSGRLFQDGSIRAQAATGTAPLADQNLVIQDPYLGKIETTTDQQGRFLFPMVTVGDRIIESPDAGLSVPVTIYSGIEVALRDFPVSRDQAVSEVMEQLQQEPNFFGVDGEAFVIAPSNPLPAGVTLNQGLGASDPETEPAPPDTVVASPQWLVYADPTPLVGYHHPTRYYLVDAETGNVQVQERSAYPVINGVVYYRDAYDHFLGNPALVQQPSLGNAQNLRQWSPPVNAQEIVKGAGRTFVFIVDGHDEGHTSSSADVSKVKEQLIPRLTDIGPVEEVVEVETSDLQPGTLTSTIQTKFQAMIAKTEPADTLVVYVTSHGSKSGPILSSWPNSILFDAVPVLQFGAFLITGSYAGEETESPGWGSLFDFEKSRACQVVIIVEACFSESMFPKLGDKRVVQFRNLDRPGRKYALLASAQRRGDPAGNSVAIPVTFVGEETGGLYTTYLNRALATVGGDNLFDQLEAAHASAQNALDTYSSIRGSTQKQARAMNPQIAVDRAEGEPSCVSDAPPEDKTACSGVSYRNTSATTRTVLFQSSSHLINDGNQVVLGPGEVFNETFDDPLECLNLIVIPETGPPIDGAFCLEVECGMQQVFVFDDGGGETFFQEELP